MCIIAHKLNAKLNTLFHTTKFFLNFFSHKFLEGIADGEVPIDG